MRYFDKNKKLIKLFKNSWKTNSEKSFMREKLILRIFSLFSNRNFLLVKKTNFEKFLYPWKTNFKKSFEREKLIPKNFLGVKNWF